MKVIVPMAGRGSRFKNVGETTPKPLIPVLGKPMLYWALKSIDGLEYSQLIFIALKEHDVNFDLKKTLNKLYGDDITLILIDEVTEGQLCTVLAAEEYLNSSEDILITSSDTFVKSKIKEHISKKSDDCAGLISVADLPGDRWSFAKVDDAGRVVEVAEKRRISNHASTGLYYFSNGREFVTEAKKIIENKEKAQGEYYVIPVYQKFLEKGLSVEISIADEVYDMGTPESLRQSLEELSKRF
jgi:UDP-N-acetylglucosamine diphosphorylase / glucose-1-phosphate thymidylyltransferase / UDP-N-acetylgalactosamine diphosphorylase / glucosamine-1-phosphate N-acetyltransferase / galactosamine-1-phosphate N-acetyltransferase